VRLNRLSANKIALIESKAGKARSTRNDAKKPIFEQTRPYLALQIFGQENRTRSSEQEGFGKLGSGGRGG
jgi:hypothetical protein